MKVTEATLSGVYEIELDVFADERGSFREAWQQEKLTALGLPAVNPVQFNISESVRGVLRGIHAEPWDKYIHIVQGEGVSVIVDLREDSPTFGQHQHFALTTSKALFVPKGMGNSFQATSERVHYAYLVTDHWRAGLSYPAIAWDDPDLAIAWPLAHEATILSPKDQANATMRQAYPHRYPTT